jgi:hypothetical protein
MANRAFFRIINKKIFTEDLEKRLERSIPSDCQVNVATFCFTAYPTVNSNKGRGFYLVQHYEPLFFQDEASQQRARATYDLPLRKLCVSHWLTEKLNGEYIGNGVNTDKFKKRPILKDDNSVMLVVRQGINWKNPQLYEKLANTLRRSGFKVNEAKGQLFDNELIEIYNKSSVLVYLSKEKEGFGLIPLESMACGTPVISTPCAEYFKDEYNCLILRPEPSCNDILQKITFLFNNKKVYNSLVTNGLKTLDDYDFKQVVDRFEKAIT